MGVPVCACWHLHVYYEVRCTEEAQGGRNSTRATGLLSAAPCHAGCLHECGRLCLCVHKLSPYCAQNRDGFACHIYTTLEGLHKECLPKATGPAIYCK